MTIEFERSPFPSTFLWGERSPITSGEGGCPESSSGASLSLERTEANFKKLAALEEEALPALPLWEKRAARLFEAMDDCDTQKVVCCALLDSYLNGGDLQGTNLRHTSKVYNRLVALYRETYDIKNAEWAEIQNQLELLSINSTLAPKNWQISLKQLEAGRSLTLPFGWNTPGKPGHSEIVRIERQANGNFALYVYNTGGGVSSYHSHAEENLNRRINPCSAFKEIPEKFFLDRSREGDPSWMEMLSGLKTVPLSNSGKEYDFSEKDLQERLLGPLQRFRLPDEDLSQVPTLLSQRGGTCSWDSIDAFTAVELKDPGLHEYRRFKAFANNALVTAYYIYFREELSMSTKEGDQLREILRAGVNKLAKNTSKRSGECDKVLAEGEAKERFATVRHILRELDEWDRRVEEVFLERKQHLAVNESPECSAVLRGMLEPYRPFKGKEDYPSHYCISAEPREPVSPQELPDWIKKIHGEYITSLEMSDGFEQVNHVLDCAVMYLPLPSPESEEGLKTLSYDDLAGMADKLSDLLLLYTKSCAKGVPKNSTEDFTANAILAFVHQAVLIADDKKRSEGNYDNYPRLRDYGLYRQRASIKTNFLTIAPDPSRSPLFEKLDAYFSKYETQDNLLCAFPRLLSLKDETDVHDAHYYRRLMQANPELVKKLSVSIEKNSSKAPFFKKLRINQETHYIAELIADMGNPTLSICNYWPCDVLSKELPHFVSLKQAALARHFIEGGTSFCKEKEAKSGIRYFTYAWPESTPTTISLILGIENERTWNSSTIQPEKERRRFLGQLLKDPEVVKFIESPSKIWSEYDQLGEILILLSLGESDALIPSAASLAQAMTQIELRPHYLLNHFSGELCDQLHEPLVQFLYELLMYKSASADKLDSPLNSAVSDPCFLKPFVSWIETILRTYTHPQKAIVKELDTCFFAMRQLQRVTALVRPNGTPPISLSKELGYYERWLRNPGWSEEERLLIHLYRAGAIASHRSFDEDEGEVMVQLFESWVFFKQRTVAKDRVPQDVVERVEHFLSSKEGREATARLTGHDQTKQEVIKRVIAILKLPLEGERKWKIFDFNRGVLISNQDPGFWGINLPAGVIFTPDGVTKVTTRTGDMWQDKYKRLFGSRNHCFRKSGNYVYFHDALHGHCRMWRDGGRFSFLDKKDPLIIERADGNGWAASIPPNDALIASLPKSLLADHSHWFVERAGGRTVEICDLASGALRYVIDGRSEELKTADGKRILVSSKASSNPLDNFSHFEKPCYIEQWALSSGEGGELVFPRLQIYRGVGEKLGFGESLALALSDEGFIWKENPAYRVKWQQPGGVLKTVDSYLYLTSEAKLLPKVLVPIRQLATEKEFSKYASMKIEDPVDSSKIATYHSQRLSSFVVNFDLKGSRLIPTCELGKGYLAYLHLAQRNYGKAIDQLAALDRKEPDRALQQVLQWIIMQGIASRDNNPNAAAVRLLAAEFLLRCEAASKKRETLLSELAAEEKENFYCAVEKDLKKYVAAINHVREECLLDANNVESLMELLSAAERNTVVETYRSNQKFVFQKWINVSHPPEVEDCLWSPTPSDSGSYQLAKDLSDLTCGKHVPASNPITLAEILSKNPEQWLPNHFLRLYERALSDSDEERTRLECYLWMIGGAMQASRISREHPSFFLYKILLSAYRTEDRSSFPPIPVPCAGDFEKSKAALHAFFIELHGKINRSEKSVCEVQFIEGESDVKSSSVYPRRPSQPADETVHKGQEVNTVVSMAAGWSQLFEERRVADLEDVAPISFPKEEVEGLTSGEKSIIEELVRCANIGWKKKQQQIVYSLTSSAALVEKLHSLEETISSAEKGIERVLGTINALASPHNSDPLTNISEQLSAAAGGIGEVKFGKLLRLYLAKNPNRYSEVNHHLNSEERALLDALMTEYLVELTELQHLKRIRRLAEELVRAQGNDEIFRHKVQELGTLVNSAREYNPVESRALLVFEAIDNKRIRPDQAELLKLLEKNPIRNGIFALPMGGGKTSVIASIWAHLVAAQNRLACLLVPEAQLPTVRKNLQRIQKEGFGQEIIEVDAKGKELTVEKLTSLLSEVERAKREGHLVLLSPESLQHLELQAMNLCDQLSRLPEGAPLPFEKLQRLVLAYKLVTLFRTEPAAFIDEVALLLSSKKEVNFPIGERRPMKLTFIELVRQFMEILSQDDLEAHVQMRENNQDEIASEAWENWVKPLLADRLSHYKPFGLKNCKQRLSFQRYLLGKIAPTVENCARLGEKGKMEFTSEELHDLAFLEEMQKLHRSNSPSQKEIPELVACARVLLHVVIPSVLKKRVGRDFGDARDGNPGRVCHYESKETPAATDFGLDIEAASSYLLTALSSGVTEEGIGVIAREMDRSARHSSKISQENYEETAEAREFEAITGIRLDESENPEQRKKAKSFLESNPLKLLDFQSLMIAHRVHCYDECLTSTSARLVEQLKHIFGGSGTPWNYKTFGKGLSKGFIPDAIHEGSLLYTLLSRGESGESKVHRLESFEPKPLLDLLEKEGYGFLVDVGGRVDQIPELCRSILDRLDPYEAVLFYCTRGLVLLRKGHKKPLIIEGSRKEDIAAYVDPGKVFYLFDQAHSIGTDFPIPENRRGIVIVDASSTLEEIEQGSARARQIQQKQRVDFAIPERSSDRFFQKGAEVRHLFINGAFNSCKELCEEAKRSYRRRIVNAVQQLPLSREIFTESLLCKGVEAIGRTLVARYKKSRELLVTKRSDQMWERFGLSERGVNYVDTLKKLAEETLAKLPKSTRKKERELVRSEVEDIISEAKEDPILAGLSENLTLHELGTEQEVNQEISVEQELNVETETSQALLKVFTEAQQEPFIRTGDLLLPKLPSSIDEYYSYGNPTFLKGGRIIIERAIEPVRRFFNRGSYEQPYEKLFSTNFHINRNAGCSDSLTPSRFSRYFGDCDAVLAYKEKGGQFEFAAISRSDATRFKQHEFTKNDPWLINTQGQLLAVHPTRFPYDPKIRKNRSPQAQAIQKFLFELNLFNGNAAYLALHEVELSPKWSSDNVAELRRNYLRLLVERDAWQKRCFFSNPLFGLKKEIKINTE